MADKTRIQTLINSLDELPTLPSVFFTVNKMLSDPRTSAIDIGKAISLDQVIASKVLKLANSSFYGFTSRVNTIPHAVAVLGFSSTKNIVLTTSVISTLNLKARIKGFSLADFWKHSAAVGTIAKLIANESYPQKREEAFVAGLLHDIGKLILAICAPEFFAETIKLAISKNCLFLEVEKEVVGISHPETVAHINNKWNLPEEITAVIINHHRNIGDAGEYAMLTAIVQLADILARGLQFGHPCDFSMPIIEDNVLDLIKITPKKLDKILRDSYESLQSAMVFVKPD
ncbi:MAG: HDOD domain-containing protein [Fibromonadales bacterium]|nr:HDOD domain-containing protein [Fibromonadales bacterium]